MTYERKKLFLQYVDADYEYETITEEHLFYEIQTEKKIV